MLRQLADAALAVLLAPCCAVCNAVLERPLDGAVCPGCWARVARFSPPLCQRCGEPLPSVRALPEGVCPACSVTLGAATAVRSVGAFDGTLADIVHALKYGRRPSVAAPLAGLMRDAGGDLLAAVDLVVPVPLHRRRERERGFNQAEALARGLGPAVCLALTRPRPTAPQVGLSGAARRANLQGAFRLTRAATATAGPRGRGGRRRADDRRHRGGVRRRAHRGDAADDRGDYGSPSRERTAAMTAACTASGG